MQKQQKFDFEKIHWKFRFSHGGVLRNSRKGRGARPLSGKEPLLSFTRSRIGKNSVTGTLQKLWKYRPFTRVIRGWKAYKTVRNYVQLNEQEILGNIPYRKQRLRGLSSNEWEILWT